MTVSRDVTASIIRVITSETSINTGFGVTSKKTTNITLPTAASNVKQSKRFHQGINKYLRTAVSTWLSNNAKTLHH